MPPSPTYAQSPLAALIQKVKAVFKVSLAKIKEKTETKERRLALSMLELLKKSLECTKTVAGYFDEQSIPSTFAVAQMAIFFMSQKDTFSKHTLAKKHGTRAYKTFLAMREVAKKQVRKTTAEIMTALRQAKKSIVDEANQAIDTTDAGLVFDEFLSYYENTICKSNAFDSAKSLESYLKSFESQIFFGIDGEEVLREKKHAASSYQITDSQLTPVFTTMLQQIHEMPVELQACIPFFNPKAIEVTKANQGLWKKLLDFFYGENASFEFEHNETQPGSSCFMYTYRSESSPGEVPVDLQSHYITNKYALMDLMYGLMQEYNMRNPFKEGSQENQLLREQQARLWLMNEYKSLKVTKLNELSHNYIQLCQEHARFIMNIAIQDLSQVVAARKRLLDIRSLEAEIMALTKESKKLPFRTLLEKFPELQPQLNQMLEAGIRLRGLDEPLPDYFIQFSEDPTTSGTDALVAECGCGFLVHSNLSGKLKLDVTADLNIEMSKFAANIEIDEPKMLALEKRLNEVLAQQAMQTSFLSIKTTESAEFFEAHDAIFRLHEQEKNAIELLRAAALNAPLRASDKPSSMVPSATPSPIAHALASVRIIEASPQLPVAPARQSQQQADDPLAPAPVLVARPALKPKKADPQASSVISRVPNSSPKQEIREEVKIGSAAGSEVRRGVKKTKPIHGTARAQVQPSPPIITTVAIVSPTPIPIPIARPQAARVRTTVTPVVDKPSQYRTVPPPPLHINLKAKVTKTNEACKPTGPQEVKVCLSDLTSVGVPDASRQRPVNPAEPGVKTTVDNPTKSDAAPSPATPKSFTFSFERPHNNRGYEVKTLMAMLDPLKIKQKQLFDRKQCFINDALDKAAAKQLTALINGLTELFTVYQTSPLSDAEAKRSLKKQCSIIILAKENDIFQQHRSLFALISNFFASIARYFNSRLFQTDTKRLVDQTHHYFTNMPG